MSEIITTGLAHKFGDDINTDYIISSRHKRDTTDCDVLKKHIFADIRDDFYDHIKPGDILVCGHNFGCGSAMEVAAMVVAAAGFRVVIAKSFARSFYRNGMNNGILLVETDTDTIEDGQRVEIRLDKYDGLSAVINGEREIPLGKLNPINRALYNAGGLIEYVNKYGTLPN